MEDSLFSFLNKLFSGSFELFDKLIAGIPIAKDAIMWAFFVYLAFNLIILPIRGVGSSDRARAKSVLSGRSESDRVKKERNEAAALKRYQKTGKMY